jgi:hypothetical protein
LFDNGASRFVEKVGTDRAVHAARIEIVLPIDPLAAAAITTPPPASNA